jgi:glucose/arabinose dehydrogenase
MAMLGALVVLPLAPAAVAAPSPSHVRLTPVLKGSGFSQPLGLVSAKDGTGRLFVVEKTGKIRVWHSGSTQATPYLDLSGAVSTVSERGLLGLAFDSDFRHRPYAWVVYTATDGTIVLRRYKASSYTAPTLDPTSGRSLLSIPHNAGNHNGGQLAFGTDDLLYWTVGDNADRTNAQNPGRLLGKVLRLDVHHSCAGHSYYCIPSSNPFARSSRYRGEVWLWGLRNPWRLSIDRVRKWVWVADVGQNTWEEVDVLNESYRGANLGWGCYEGPVVYDASLCDSNATYLKPKVYYSHSVGSAITGGFAYNGLRYHSALGGLYVYGDFGSGRVWVYQYGGAAVSQGALFGANQLTSFGEDQTGELWAVTIDGRLWAFAARYV